MELKDLEFRLFVASSPLLTELTAGMQKQLQGEGVLPRFTLAVSPKARKTLLAEGFDKAYGARPLKRVIDKRIQLPLSKLVNSGQIQTGDTVVVDEEGNANFEFYIHNPKETQ
jgi:ATP-dependent Clp protease ATP-binding subunit ClpA